MCEDAEVNQVSFAEVSEVGFAEVSEVGFSRPAFATHFSGWSGDSGFF